MGRINFGCISTSAGLVTGSCRGSLGAGQPLFGVWFPGCLARLGRDYFFISRCGIVGITDLGLPFWGCGQNWLLLFG